MCIPQVLEPFSTWNTMNNVVQILIKGKFVAITNKDRQKLE